MTREFHRYEQGQRIGSYRIAGVIGRGGWGTVYEAQHEMMGRRVAIHIPGSEQTSPDLLDRLCKHFRQAAALMSKLDHPNVDGLYDAGEIDGIPYLVIERLDGETLSKAIQQELPTHVVLRIAVALASALEHAHEKGIVHRNVDPSHIMITCAGQPVLVGFGFAAPTTGDPLIELGEIVGTPGFMSPEHARGEPVSPQFDIWGLGATLYCIAAGYPPYGPTKPSQEMNNVTERAKSSDPVDLAPIEGKVPAYVFSIIAKCLEKDLNKRYQSVATLRRDLEMAVGFAEQEESKTKATTPQGGQTILLHVEYQEVDIPGAYRKYEIGRFVGSGTYGEVFEVTELLSGKTQALKILKHEWLSNPDIVSRFRREATLLSRLSHPNVLKVYNFGRFGPTFFIAMDFLDGPNLKNILEESSPMDVSESLNFILPIMSALAAMHEIGVIHRDLKPANVKKSKDTVVVCDFGLSTAADVTRLTLSNTVLGTAAYMPPEQASGRGALPASDVYSAGVILYELLTKRRPHEESSIPVLLSRIVNEPPIPISTWRPELETALVSTLESMLAKDWQARPSAAEARRVLAEIG